MQIHFGLIFAKLVEEVDKDNSGDNTWNAVYHNDVKPLSRLEKESKYSSKLLPTGNLPKPRNSYDLDSAAMKTCIGIKMSQLSIHIINTSIVF